MEGALGQDWIARVGSHVKTWNSGQHREGHKSPGLLLGRTDGCGVDSEETLGHKTGRVVGMAQNLKDRLDFGVRPAFEHP